MPVSEEQSFILATLCKGVLILVNIFNLALRDKFKEVHNPNVFVGINFFFLNVFSILYNFHNLNIINNIVSDHKILVKYQLNHFLFFLPMSIKLLKLAFSMG